MFLTPIIILTKDNPEYLYITLKSLTATETFNNPIIIVDDCSTLANAKAMLYTNDKIDVTFDDWTIKDQKSSQEFADKTAAKIVLNIPKINKILGINKKFSVVKTPKYLGSHYRTLFGINLGFTLYPNADHVIILEDDIIFNKHWFEKLKRMDMHERFEPNIAMVSNYNNILKPSEEIKVIKNGDIKGKACMFTKAFYKALKKYDYFSNSNLKERGTSFELLQNIAHKLGFSCYVTNYSWIQCLEKRNLVNKDKVLMYDDTFIQPVAWNENF